MRFVSNMAVALACLSAALAFLLYLRKKKGLSPDDLRLCWLAVAGFFAFGLSRVVDLALIFSPDAVGLEDAERVALSVALAASLAVWGLMPPLLARPSSTELIAANRALEEAVAARTRELDEANQRFINALKDTGISMAQQDHDLRYLWAHNLPFGLRAEDVIGRTQEEAFPAQTEPAIAAAKRRAMDEKATQYLDVSLDRGGETIWLHERAEPLMRDGQVVGVLTTAIDTTAYRRQEEELRDLLRELTHRTKNLLAVIVGIARQSSRGATDVRAFVGRFNSRIRALSLAHELLVDASWRGVSLRLLIEGVWRNASSAALTRLTLTGEDVFVAPEAAQNLALAFHEMANNAIEHGRLLQGDRRVAIGWARRPPEGDDFELVWCENGEAFVAEPKPDGFGKTFVLRQLPRATRGVSTLETAPEGLRWIAGLPRNNFVAPPLPQAKPAFAANRPTRP